MAFGFLIPFWVVVVASASSLHVTLTGQGTIPRILGIAEGNKLHRRYVFNFIVMDIFGFLSKCSNASKNV